MPPDPRVRPSLSSLPPDPLVMTAPRRASAPGAQAHNEPDFISSLNLRVADSSSPTAATNSSPRSSLYIADDALPYLPPQCFTGGNSKRRPAAYTVTISTIRYASRNERDLHIVHSDQNIQIAALEAKRATSHSVKAAARHYLCFLAFVIPSTYTTQLSKHTLDDEQLFPRFLVEYKDFSLYSPG
ncbi:hypothetical protein LZ30DRAFT_694839 [Colletotrichum cereale]|nr:hypothetical protein LZ30DRAFT_694839 [Colletotrichum cereale]